MKNVFLFLDAVIDRLITVQMEYVLDMPIGSIILMAESHYTADLDCFYGNKNVQIYSTLQECLEHCDTIIVSDNHLSRLRGTINKDIIVVNLSNGIHEDSNFSIPKLNYYGKPVIAILSLGEFTDQYITEILINKILTDHGAKIAQYYSPLTKRIIESCFHAGHLNASLSASHIEDYDIIVLAINGSSSYPNLLRIMCDISPDIILLCVNKSYRQEEELKRCLYGCGNIEAIIRSPYISYEIVKGKTYPVYCGKEKSNSYYGSFEKNLYDVLEKCVLRKVYLPENVVVL